MKKIITLLFLVVIIAPTLNPTFVNSFSNDINNVDFLSKEKNTSKNIIKQVSLGWEHSAVITNDGTNDHLYTWGSNWNGELGIGTSNTFEMSPQEVDINGNKSFGVEGEINKYL